MPSGCAGWRRLPARPTASTRACWPSCAGSIWCRRSGFPTRPPAARASGRFRLHLVKHRSSLKNRIHQTLLSFGQPCPLSDLFGVRGRRQLERLELPEPWAGTLDASLRLIDELDREIATLERQLRQLGADHPYV